MSRDWVDFNPASSNNSRDGVISILKKWVISLNRCDPHFVIASEAKQSFSPTKF